MLLHFRKIIFILFIGLQANIVSALGLDPKSILYMLLMLVILYFIISPHHPRYLIVFFVSLALLFWQRHINGNVEGSIQLSAILAFPALFTILLPNKAEKKNDYSFYKLVLKSLVLLFFVEFIFSYIEFFLHISILSYTNDTYDSQGPMSRATSLFGASLSNSLIISGLLFFILNSNLKNKYKFFIWSAGFLSLMCFQGRIAMIVSFTYLFLYLFSHMKKDVRKNFTSFILGISILCIIIIAFYMGLGDRLLNMGVFDESSSSVRSRMFEHLIDNYKLKDLLWGMSMDNLLFLMMEMQVLVIECFFVIHLLFFGLVFLIVFYTQYVLLIKKMLCEYELFFKIIAIPAYILIAFTNNSFASGSTSLTMLLLFIRFFSPSVFNKVVPSKYLVTAPSQTIVNN